MLKAMFEDMLKEFKTDMMSSVEEIIENRINEGEQEEEHRDGEEPGADPTLNVQALVNNVIAGDSETHDTSQENTSVDALLDEFNPEKAQGPPINDKLAVLINSLLKDGLTKEQLSIKKEYAQPENCPNLDTPKVNNMLWTQLKQEPKNLDASTQKGQGYLMSAIYALVNVCNEMMTKGDNKPLTKLTHSLVLLMSANRQFNLSRRELLRPHLNKNYQALCNPSVPITTYLFGDDLNKQVDDLTKANRIGQKVNQGKPKYHPYTRNTFRGRFKHGYSGRGKATNTTGRGAFLGSSRGFAPRRQTK